jgi:raffinose/stachyose/melibiose transport system permease protein
MTSAATGANLPLQATARRRRYMDRKSLIPLLVFLPPSLILFTVFVVLPMVDAATFSFFDWNGYGPITDFVGFENYADVLTHRNFGTAVRNSLIVVAVSLLIQLPLAMWAALALSERGVSINVLRTIFFVPFMLAEVAAGLIWKFVYDGNYGLLPIVGDALQVEMPFVLADKFWVIPALIALNSDAKYTWPLGIMQFQGQYGSDWPRILAFLTLSILPAVLFFLAAQRYIISGLTGGAVKG